jgi:hypothetical protein
MHKQLDQVVTDMNQERTMCNSLLQFVTVMYQVHMTHMLFAESCFGMYQLRRTDRRTVQLRQGMNQRHSQHMMIVQEEAEPDQQDTTCMTQCRMMTSTSRQSKRYKRTNQSRQQQNRGSTVCSWTIQVLIVLYLVGMMCNQIVL